MLQLFNLYSIRDIQIQNLLLTNRMDHRVSLDPKASLAFIV